MTRGCDGSITSDNGSLDRDIGVTGQHYGAYVVTYTEKGDLSKGNNTVHTE